MTKEKIAKQITGQRRKIALVLPSEDLLNLLALANLVPATSPNGGFMRRGLTNRTAFNTWRSDYQNSLFNWAIKLENGVDDENLNAFWLEFKVTLGILPLALHAFVLFDEQGEVHSLDSPNMLLVVNEDFQIGKNLTLLKEPQGELKILIEKATSRIQTALFEYGLQPDEMVPQFSDIDDPKRLLRRALHRFIFAFGVQAIFNFLTYPKLKTSPFFDLTAFQSFSVSSYLEVDQSGLIHFNPSVVIRALESVEADRIRICFRCFKFYWAGRKDMRCCSTLCAQSLRMREYRIRSNSKNQTEENIYGEKR